LEKFVPTVKLIAARQRMPAFLLFLVVGGISLSVCGVATEAAPGQSHSTAGLSQAAANGFQAKVMELSEPGPIKGQFDKPVVITDTEVNSFIKYDRPEFLPPSVSDVDIRFKPEGVYGAANVNFDQLKPASQLGDQLGARLLASIFRGTQRVKALGVVESGNGTGKLTIKNVQIGSTALSDWLVNWLIETYVQNEYKIDLSKPFLLPGQVTRVEFAPGRAIFIRGTKQKK
jgi:hypothetical protein